MGSKAFTLDNDVVAAIREEELLEFHEKIPTSRALYEQSRQVLTRGVPSSWMASFYPGTDIFAARGEGCFIEDVDGNRYLDMTQCDLSMVCGYGPEPVAKAVAERFTTGSHFLLPTEDAIAVGSDLAKRFGMPFWQFTLSASAANTEAIRIARFATGRDKVLIFAGKYHGHFDESLVKSTADGMAPEHLGLPKDAAQRTVVVPFNDLEAVETALGGGEIACVLTEPVMTNFGVILPDEGFHEGLRALTKQTGTILIVDETHTQAAAYGGFTRAWGLEPDVLTSGKCLGGGVPIGGYGLSSELNAMVERNLRAEDAGGVTLALGGTTYGNALNMAAARAALEHILTEAAYERVRSLGSRLADGIDAIVTGHGLPWRAYRLGNRSGICLSTSLPRNAAEASSCISEPLNLATRAFMANRGIWEPIYIHGPSISFAHTEPDVGTYLSALETFVGKVVAAHA
jgi:glutamate-1-semialdehyde aminotransferase